jgi:hypothetical protein
MINFCRFEATRQFESNQGQKFKTTPSGGVSALGTRKTGYNFSLAVTPHGGTMREYS